MDGYTQYPGAQYPRWDTLLSHRNHSASLEYPCVVNVIAYFAFDFSFASYLFAVGGRLRVLFSFPLRYTKAFLWRRRKNTKVEIPICSSSIWLELGGL